MSRSTTTRRLKELSLYMRRGISPKYVEEHGTVVLNQKCVRKQAIDLELSRLTGALTRIPAEKVLQPGDIVVNSTGTGTVGRVARFLGHDRPVTADSHLTIVRPNSAIIDPAYLGYFLGWREPIIEGMAKGATNQVELSVLRLGELEVSVPALEVQRQLGQVLSAYDDLIENNRRRMLLLEAAARHLYREWFVRIRFPGHEHTRITNGMPQGWERTTALSAMEVLSGGTPKTTIADYWDGDIPFYTPRDASDAAYASRTSRSITELGLKNCNSRLYETDTVFISARGTVGKLNLASRPMAMSQSCYALVGRGRVSQLFLFCALKEAIEHFRQHAGGAVFDAIVVDTFKLIPFTVPSEQKVRLFEESVAPIFRQIANLLEQNEKLRAARDLLLPRMMNGEIA